MKDFGFKEREVAKDHKSGQMDKNMTENSRMIKDMDKDHKFFQTEENIQDNGRMEKSTDQD